MYLELERYNPLTLFIQRTAETIILTINHKKKDGSSNFLQVIINTIFRQRQSDAIKKTSKQTKKNRGNYKKYLSLSTSVN